MKFAVFLFLGFFALTSCEKSFENFSPAPDVDDTIWSVINTSSLPINELHQALSTPALSDSIDLLTGGTINFGSGIRMQIPASAFTSNGTIVNGRGIVELHLLKRKGDLIRFRRPTTSNGYLLQSGGVLHIAVKNNGQVLQLGVNKMLSVSFEDSQSIIPMRGFYGVSANTNSFDNFNWLPVFDSSIMVNNTTLGYQVITNRLQWINCDIFTDTAAQKSRTVLSMPRDFTNANTSAFVVFKNIRAVMQFTPDAINRIWKTEKIPVAKEVLYVTITKKRNEYWLGSINAITAPFQNIHIVPEKKTLQEIGSFLDGL
jgi:hypothetical protein